MFNALESLEKTQNYIKPKESGISLTLWECCKNPNCSISKPSHIYQTGLCYS